MSDLVRVYRNLRNNKLSVQRYIKGKGWRVSEHVDAISLEGVTFKVHQKPRERVLRTKRKTVHAYVYGTPIEFDPQDFRPGYCDIVGYNPYKYTSFVIKSSERPIHTAYVAEVKASGSILVVE